MRNRTGNVDDARVPRRSGVAGLFLVPGVGGLVADPEQIRVLDAHTTRALKTQAITALVLLNSHDLEAARVEPDGHTQHGGDRLLNVGQAAEKLAVKPDWLYRHHRHLPFRVRH